MYMNFVFFFFFNLFIGLLCVCHRPDASIPIEETVRAMNYVIDKGWAFYWGTSEWSAQQITEAWGAAERLDLVGPIVEQPEYNMFTRHKVCNLQHFSYILGSLLVKALSCCCVG